MNNLGNKKIMAENICYYMNKYGKTRNEMCDALGVKYTTFTDWVKGNTYPRIDKIELMANYFGVTKADLVEIRSDSQPSSEFPALRPDEVATLSLYNQLNEEGREKAADYLDDLVSSGKYIKNCEDGLLEAK